jgi:hypothetical protein
VAGVPKLNHAAKSFAKKITIISPILANYTYDIMSFIIVPFALVKGSWYLRIESKLVISQKN